MRVSRSLLAVGMVAGFTVGLAAQAEAATGYARCPADRMCVFTSTNGSGVIGIFANGDVNLGDSTGPTGLNNNIESMINKTSVKWCFYDGINYNGKIWQGGPGGGANTIPAATNTISSLKRDNTC
jgi:hypothetical protein